MKKKIFAAAASDSPRLSPVRSAFLWIPVLAAFNTLVIELFNHKVFTTGFSSFGGFLLNHPLALLVDFLLVLITLVPALFLRRRVFYLTLISAVWLIAGSVNGFILFNRMTPFTTADLTVFSTGIDTLPNYMSTGYIILLVVALVLLAAALVVLAWKGPRSSTGWKRRVVTGLVALAISGGALVGSWALAFQTEQLSTVFSNLAYAYEDYGFAYCFLQTWLNTGIRRPDNYSQEEMERIRAEIEADTPARVAEKDVNVLFVQLESFIPPSEIKGLELSEDATPNWHALEDQFTSGYLTVPVVGAGTANTECEVLTGMSTRYFGPGEYPFKTCLTDQTTESVAYDLKALGYATHAIHNHRATFYGRNQVYPNLGFDDFTSLEFMPRVFKTPQNWAKDYILSSQITEALDSTANQSDLVFTVSVQGHGSYPTEKVLTDPAITVTAAPADVNANAAEYYVNQIHEMDTFIGDLVNKLSARDEKTVLVLYGDHLPSLGLERSDMESGSLYKTQYLIWDNLGLKQRDQNLCAYELSSFILGRLGITNGLMNAFHQFCKDEPTYRSDLKAIQYDVLYGQDYLDGGKTPYEATDMKMGVLNMKVTGLFERLGTWYVEGENFSPYCKVTVDGKVLKTSYVSTTLLRLDEDPNTDSYKNIGISVLDLHKEVLSTVPSVTEQEEAAASGDSAS